MKTPNTANQRRRLRLLYVGDAALALECLGRPGGSIEVIPAAPGTSRAPLPLELRPGGPSFDVLFIEHAHPGVDTLAILSGLAAVARHVPAVIVADWDEQLAVAALRLGASDYVTKSTASFRAVYFRLNRLTAQSALLSEQSRLRQEHAAAIELRQEHTAAIEHARADREDLVRRLAEAQQARSDVERRLHDAVVAIKQARRDRLSDAVAAAEEHARREFDFATTLAEANAAARRLGQQVADQDAALRRAGQRAAEQQALSQEFAAREAGLAAKLREEAAHRHTLETKLTSAALALHAAEQQRMAEAAESADRLARQQAELTTTVAQGDRAREALERRLRDTQLALQRSGYDRAAEVTVWEERLAQQQVRYDARLAEAAADAGVLQSQLADAVAAMERARADRAAEASAAAERAAHIDAERAREAANREAVEAQLRDTQLALQRSEHDRAADAAAWKEQQAQYEARLSEAAVVQDDLQSRLDAADAALSRVERRAALERQLAADEAAQRQAGFEAELAHQETSRRALARARAEADAARQLAEDQRASDVAAAAAQLAEQQQQTETWLADAAAVATSLEARLLDVTAAFERAGQQAASERHDAAEQAARDVEHVEARLRQEVARRRAVDDEVRAVRAASEQALVAHAQRVNALEDAHQEERARLEQARVAIEGDLARQRAEYSALHQTLDRARTTAREAVERISRERATERAGLEALVAERDTQLAEQAARRQASDEAAAAALTAVEHRLHETLAASQRAAGVIAHLQERVAALDAQLNETSMQRDTLKATADRVPQLLTLVDTMGADHRRQYDRTPVSLFRCGRDGQVTSVNQALAGLLGYNAPDEVPTPEFANAVFENGDELHWVIGRCLATSSTESVETTWKRRDGSRIIVRVHAAATTDDWIDLAVEDVTRFRVLEEKLRHSQRMEAVARYGSEIAVTCHTLLRHVTTEGQQWLAGMDSDTARYQGELLLDEVTRAEAFMRKLAVYGNEQKNVPELVDVNVLLRDLAPVLKRVAGDDIEIVVPHASTPLNLDVEPGRVERMLVNVAAYGRERMPLGGRLTIEVAPVVVDRTFVAKYPNVRLGAHVLLTITERRSTARPAASTGGPYAYGASAAWAASDKPGVDLGTLQSLVSDCGGHLWMMAEPQGDMVLKLHLPRRVLDRLDPRAPAKKPGRPRWLQRAFGATH